MAEHAGAHPVKIQQYLRDISYPASRQKLIDTAIDHGASAEIVASVRELPNKEYAAPTDVMAELAA